MARVSCCSRCVVKTEEEEFILPNGRPEIGPHAKTEEETECNTGWGYPDVRHPGGRGVAFHGLAGWVGIIRSCPTNGGMVVVPELAKS